MGFMEIMMKKGFIHPNKAAGISFNRVSCEATFTGDRTLKTTAPTQKNLTSLTVSVAYKVVASPGVTIQQPVYTSTGFSNITDITLQLILSFCNGIELAKVAQASKVAYNKSSAVA